MGKKKNTGAKRGPPQHFNGVQKDFLTEHVSTYLNALDADNNGTEAGCFYTKMAREYSDKWCNDEAEDEAEASEPLTKAKAENASKSFIKLREVSQHNKKSKTYLSSLSRNWHSGIAEITNVQRSLREQNQG